jgi:hypothetical protein
MFTVRTIGPEIGGRQVKVQSYEFSSMKNALVQALQILAQENPQEIVLILDSKGRVVFNRGFHTNHQSAQ